MKGETENNNPLLAGYVDDQLTRDERRRVESLLEQNERLAEELAAQREAAAAMAAYPVAEVPESQWRRMWQEVGSRLPAGAKRISLESLTEMDISADMLNEEGLFDQDMPAVLPESPLVAVKTDTLPPRQAQPPATPATPATPTPPAGDRKRPEADGANKPLRLSNSKRLATAGQTPRLKLRRRRSIWAHLAGLAAAAAVITIVLLSVRPVVPQVKLARAGEVVIEMNIDDASNSMIRMMQDEQGRSIPMIWIAQTPVESPGAANGQY